MKTDFVQAGAVRLQYFEQGEGPETVVLVHGYQSSGRVWRLTQEAFDPARLRTIAISNRGAGDSDRTPSEDDYRVESFAADLYEAVRALGLREFTLVGHSMGGATVTRFALDHPGVIKALVLLDSVGLDGVRLPPGWEEQLRDQIKRTGAPPERREPAAPAPADFRDALQADVDRNPIERWIGSRRSMGDIRLRGHLGELKMPVFVVGGDQDMTVGIENILTDFLALSAANRSLHIFHGAGHSPNVAVAGPFAKVLESFILETVPRLSAAVAGS
jgi:branched-chain amino acid transport system permease protein